MSSSHETAAPCEPREKFTSSWSVPPRAAGATRQTICPPPSPQPASAPINNGDDLIRYDDGVDSVCNIYDTYFITYYNILYTQRRRRRVEPIARVASTSSRFPPILHLVDSVPTRLVAYYRAWHGFTLKTVSLAPTMA